MSFMRMALTVTALWLKGPDNYNNNENKPEGQKWSDLLDQYAKYHKTLHFD